MSRLFALLFVLAVAGCATQPPDASGPYRALNPGRWQPAPVDLRDVPTPRPPLPSPALDLSQLPP